MRLMRGTAIHRVLLNLLFFKNRYKKSSTSCEMFMRQGKSSLEKETASSCCRRVSRSIAWLSYIMVGRLLGLIVKDSVEGRFSEAAITSKTSDWSLLGDASSHL